MGGFLSNDSAFGRLMTRLGVIIGANILFMFCTIPIITIGAGFAGLHHTILRMLRGDGVINPFKEFFKGFKSNFKQATAVWLLYVFIAGFMGLEWFWCGQFGGFFLVIRIGLLAMIIFFTILFLYMIPTICAFYGDLIGHARNAVIFAFRKPLHLLVILFFSIFPLYLTYTDPGMFPLYGFIWVLCGFGLIATLTDVLLLIQFKPLLPAVDSCGDFILDMEEEERWADPVDSKEADQSKAMKSEAEILAEMERLGM